MWDLNTLTHTHINCVKSVCVSLTVGIIVVTLGRGVSCVSNGNPDHSLWISDLLQSCKERKWAKKKEKEKKKQGDI